MKCKISLRIFKSNNSDLFSTTLSADYSEPIAKAILNALWKNEVQIESVISQVVENKSGFFNLKIPDEIFPKLFLWSLADFFFLVDILC